MLEEVLETIRKKSFEKGFTVLEIATEEGLFRIPIQRIKSLAFIEE